MLDERHQLQSHGIHIPVIFTYKKRLCFIKTLKTGHGTKTAPCHIWGKKIDLQYQRLQFLALSLLLWVFFISCSVKILYSCKKIVWHLSSSVWTFYIFMFIICFGNNLSANICLSVCALVSTCDQSWVYATSHPKSTRIGSCSPATQIR